MLNCQKRDDNFYILKIDSLNHVIDSLIILHLHSISSVTESQLPKNEENKTVEYKKKEYSIKYPSNWALDTSGVEGTNFILIVKNRLSSDEFTGKVYMKSTDIEGEDLDKVEETFLAKLHSDENVKIIESTRVRKGLDAYHRFVWTSESKKNYDNFWITAKNMYVLAFSADQNTYGKDIEEVEKVFRSFTINR